MHTVLEKFMRESETNQEELPRPTRSDHWGAGESSIGRQSRALSS